MDLTTKQRKFIDAYVKSGNATRAAIEAGYSERSARQQGWENLKNPYISEQITARLDAEAMAANEVLWRLGRMARADMGDFLTGSGENISIDMDAVKAAGLTDLIKKLNTRTTRTTDKDGNEITTTTISLELHDAQAALKELGRAHKLFTDGLDVSGTLEVHSEAEERISNKIAAIAERLRMGGGVA